MKTLIVGTGVIGTIYGWALAEAGVDVTHYVRAGTLGPGHATGARGASLDVRDARRHHPRRHRTTYLRRVTERIDPVDGYELVVVPVAARALPDVLATLEPHVGPDAVFLLMTSTWDDAATFDALLPRDRYLLGYPDGGGAVHHGVHEVELGARIRLGALDGRSAYTQAKVTALFASADMRPDVRPDILHWLWVREASTAAFATGVAAAGGAPDTGPELRRTCVQATIEALRLCESRGVRLARYPDAAPAYRPMWWSMAMARKQWSAAGVRRNAARTTTPDAAADHASIRLAMRRTADERGVPVPALTALGAAMPAPRAATGTRTGTGTGTGLSSRRHGIITS